MKTTILTIVASGFMICSCMNSADSQMKDGKAVSKPEVNEVTTTTLVKTDFARQLISNGKLRATKRASLAFGDNGVISELNVVNGSEVLTGETIAKLDRPDLKLSLDAAKIAFEKSKLDFFDILAGQGYMAKDTSNVPEEILAMAKMRSGYISAENALAQAKLVYDWSILKAPFKGKIADLSLKLYDRVNSDKFCSVIDDSSFDVDFLVMESECSFISVGLPVKVIPFSEPSKTLTGKVIEINPTINKNGQIALRARIENDGSLIDGMNVKVIVERMVPGQMVVPRSAVVVRDNLDVLFTYTEDGIAHWTYVNILLSNGESHAVAPNTDRGAELREGDQIIISGNLNLADGSKVQLKK